MGRKRIYDGDLVERKKQALKKYSEKHPKISRALNILSAYNFKDKIMGRGKGDLTAQWIVENIFTKSCKCGESDWRKLGCNRLDNSKPHTKDNVEPCCEECNSKLAGIEKSIQVYQYTMDGKLIAIYKSITAAAESNNIHRQGIMICCNGGYFNKSRDKWVSCKQYKGYRWSYKPL